MRLYQVNLCMLVTAAPMRVGKAYLAAFRSQSLKRLEFRKARLTAFPHLASRLKRYISLWLFLLTHTSKESWKVVDISRCFFFGLSPV